MKTSEDFDIKLLEYVDGALSENEKRAFEEILNNNVLLKARYDALRMMEGAIRAEQPLSPSRNFTRNVMANLHTAPAPGQGSTLNGLFLLGGVILLVIICTVLLSSGIFDAATTTIDLNQINLFKDYINPSLPSVGLHMKTIINCIIFLNLVIALLVFDRSVLKPLFQRRVNTGI